MNLNRYYSFSSFLKKKFGGSVYKISIDAGFTCPNRDGTKGFGGCYFCNNSSFAGSKVRDNVKSQISLAKEKMKKRKAKGFIAYFQSFTNTYADVSRLKELYYQALEDKDIVGISIGTRADCLPDDVLGLLKEISQKTMLWVELGLETIHDSTLKIINRGHTYQEFKEGYYRLREYVKDCYVCFHIIFGLPGEDEGMMIETMKEVNRLKPDAIKFHQLEIVKDTVFEKEYYEGRVKPMFYKEYLNVLGKALKILSPDIVIQRLYNTTNEGYIVAPKENLDKRKLLDIFLEEKNIIQGSEYHEEVYKV